MNKILALLTFPGIIFHEISHRFFCDLTKTPVNDIVYFSMSLDNNTMGYVIHNEPKRLRYSVLISFGPLILNNLLFTILLTPTLIIFNTNTNQILDYSNYIMIWIGISLLFNSIPSFPDVAAVDSFIKENKSLLWKVLFFPIKVFFIIMPLLDKLVFLRIFYLGFIYFLNLVLNKYVLDLFFNL